MIEKDILDLIRNDQSMMEILRAVRGLDLPDWWIGAGFVRSKVWDTLHRYSSKTALPDVDVIYFDPADFTKDQANQETTSAEIAYEQRLSRLIPRINWSVTNQARMHLFHNHAPYRSAAEGLSHWVETATCVGVRLNDNGKLQLVAPHGIDDLVNLTVRPTPELTDLRTFHQRVASKHWLEKWPKLQIIET